MSAPPFLYGETVALHPVEREDLEFVRDTVNDPEVWSQLGMSKPKNMEQQEQWLEDLSEEDGDVNLLVCVDGERVGTIGMHVNETWGYGELGYYVAPEAWGNGYCTDAVRTMSRYAFDERRLAKVGAQTYGTNPASSRVLEKAGFTHEGTLRKQAYIGGERVDLHHFGLLAEEFERD